MADPLSKWKIGFTHVPVTETINKSFNCNRLTLVNDGTVTATIGGCLILAPGASITYPAWPGEINDTVYQIVFPTGVNGCHLTAVCKNYTK